MKYILIALLLIVLALPITSDAAVWWGQDGRLYGNICVIPNVGSWYVNPQPVGSYCFIQNIGWGFIANG